MSLSSFSVHAHFYQPPREDPLTGEIPPEKGSAPFPNWNERIHAECYQPNAVLGNFARISFNIGPTLCTWMHRRHPDTLSKIIAQDRSNLQRYGVGNALAQAYNHTILPLSSYQDKVTQVYWGLAEFEHRFGHKAQGVWLPETAVDYETLDVLARNGVSFTILAPWQAEHPGIDPTEPYTVNLPHGRQITVFFYQRDLSGRVSFDADATINADRFALHLLRPYFNPEKARHGQAQLVVIASDGELYGHHKNHRDHFLARLVDGASEAAGLLPTYPGLWLKDHAPRQSIRILERTSWSCHHGVKRWSEACPCAPGKAEWKALLRQAFDHLADELDGLYLEAVRPLVGDPWLLRHRYIHVLLGETSLPALVGQQIERTLTHEQMRRATLLLEAQRERQRMFTSCGWFFEDFDRIEPRNCVAYAAQAVRLARQATGVDLSPGIIEDLHRVVSPHSGLSAAQVFASYLSKP
jgi:alpha-amylase/alpha-mannosidase (GH57 family)